MRTLSISFEPDMDVTMTQFAERAKRGIATGQYQGEYLNFANPALFFGRLTARRWDIVNTLMGQGTVGVRELARRMGREVRRVHEDSKILVELGLLEKTDTGALCCPYGRIQIEMMEPLAQDVAAQDVPALAEAA